MTRSSDIDESLSNTISDQFEIPQYQDDQFDIPQYQEAFEDEIERLTNEFKVLTIRQLAIAERLSYIHRAHRGEVYKARVTASPVPKTEKQASSKRSSRRRTLKEGDRVRVLNEHRGKKGTIGIIQRFTKSKAFAWVQPENKREAEFRRHKENLERVSSSESS